MTAVSELPNAFEDSKKVVENHGQDSGGLHVLQLNKHAWPHYGGIERHIEDLSVGLARQKGVTVTNLVCGLRGQTRVSTRQQVRMEAVPSFGTLWSLPLAPGYLSALRRHLIRDRPSLVHLHEPFPLGVLAWLLSSGTRRPPLVVTWHSDVIRQRLVLPLYGLILRRLLSQASAVIVPTERHIVASSYLPDFAAKCNVIPFGINIQRYLTPEAAIAGRRIRETLGQERVVLFVGRLVPYKGLPYLIRAMAQVNGVLMLVGDGRDRKTLGSLADRIGVAERVQFVGSVADEELPAYFHASDVVVLPSTQRSEGFGIVQIEAMACSKPVISTTLGTGVTIVNRHRETGLLVPPAKEGDLAEAINSILEQRDWATELGKRGQQRVFEHYSQAQMVNATLALYRRIVDN